MKALLLLMSGAAAMKVGNFCNKPCKGDADCDQTGHGCSQCTDGKCTAFSMDCGKAGKSGSPPPDVPTPFPKHFAIGDSVTLGYFKYMKRYLEGVTNSTLVARNAGPAGEGEKCIKVWLGDDLDRWDIISYNHGLWDTRLHPWHKEPVALDTYIGHLRNETRYLSQTKAYRNGKLLFVLTTPSSDTHDNKSSCCPPMVTDTLSCPSTIKDFNEAAVKMLSSEFPKVKFANLWSWVNRHCCGSDACNYRSCDFQPYHNACNVHFDGIAANGEIGWDYVAKNISGYIKLLAQSAELVV